METPFLKGADEEVHKGRLIEVTNEHQRRFFKVDPPTLKGADKEARRRSAASPGVEADAVQTIRGPQTAILPECDYI